ncbi:multidrug resistance protein B [Mycobacterium montefiorense]|uniref:Multidrug resistance protein B n=3 Tax=Mycobacterium montefiorense TaxID=154654 RepID=A0AA37UVP1_9MYCO|nr:multidrug resistance protein B homolog [Mycobacterium montefiorense]GKU32961.1 multidrug resistance protein B [Mycobacterium montefiorense]GKU38569.1 multidrug resistance protein B [Mycobacterium montefiorense]GKU46664.1 multidrug resistance protein B [Mycobacterium montefiorense]GKU51563.1 multidrug resistance protein B [Mycobacterium montefiorense]
MLGRMLSDAMEGAHSAAPSVAVPYASTGQAVASGRDYPDKLDAKLLRVVFICGLAAVMAVLDSTVVAVAQGTFVTQFNSSQAVVSWTVAAYMLAFATVIPVTGWAADRFGTKRLFIGSVLVFMLGSLLCAIAPTIMLLIVFRVIQGIGGGMLMPLSFVILTHEAGPKRVGRLMAIGGIPILLGPIGGPILGGWLVGAYGWEWIFLINLPIGLLAIVLAAITFPKDRPAPAEKLDIVSVLLLPPGVTLFLAGVSSIPAQGTITAPAALVPTIMGLLLVAAFVLHSFRTDHPLIDLRLFKNRVVTHANLALLVFGAPFVGLGLLVPSYFQVVMHQTPMHSGLYLLPVGLGAVLTMPLAGAFMDKRGPGLMVLIGLPTMAVGLGIFTYGVATEAAYNPTLLIGLAVMGLGVGCTTTPLSAAVLQSLAPHQVARGTTLVTVNQQVSGSIGAALLGVILTQLFAHNETLVTASKLVAAQQQASGQRMPIEASSSAWKSMGPDFANNVTHGFSHAYTAVFVVAVALLVLTIIPAAFLPMKRPEPERDPEPAEAPAD